MLILLTLVVIGLVVFAMVREGIFSAICHLFGVIFAGLVAFHVWPALATLLEESFDGSTLAGYEDALSLFSIYLIVGFLCRLLTNVVADREIEMPPQLNQILAGSVGAVTGYLLAGFLACVLQTLPWEEAFLGYVPPKDADKDQISNKVFPPDQIWLKIMNRSAFAIFEDDDVPEKTRMQFQQFTYKFAKHRRFPPGGSPLPFPPPPQPKKEEPKKEVIQPEGSVPMNNNTPPLTNENPTPPMPPEMPPEKKELPPPKVKDPKNELENPDPKNP